MSFGENIKNSLKMICFNEQAMTDVSNSDKATGYGFLTLVIAGIAMAISQLNILGLILNPIGLIIGLFIGYSIFHFIAKFILGGQATGVQYFRSLSNSFVVYWFTFIPLIGIILQVLAGLWLMVINIFILHRVHKLSVIKAVILGLLPLIVVLVMIFLGAVSYMGLFSPAK
jgi:hypothetical protein